MTTGVTMRVTASWLRCETWPRCNEDSLVPVPGAAPALHQAVEFGNRLLTFVLTAVAVALILAVLRAGRRHQITLLALAMPLGIVAQAVIGGITVLTGLLWWTVALHLMPSMVLAWVAAILFVRIGEDDEAPARRVVPAPPAWPTALPPSCSPRSSSAGPWSPGRAPTRVTHASRRRTASNCPSSGSCTSMPS